MWNEKRRQRKASEEENRSPLYISFHHVDESVTILAVMMYVSGRETERNVHTRTFRIKLGAVDGARHDKLSSFVQPDVD